MGIYYIFVKQMIIIVGLCGKNNDYLLTYLNADNLNFFIFKQFKINRIYFN